MLGKRLRELREELKMTQARLARELGISPNAISQYENGDRQPNYEVLKKICKFFSVTADDMLGFEEE